jgi:hypothetical protein
MQELKKITEKDAKKAQRTQSKIRRTYTEELRRNTELHREPSDSELGEAKSSIIEPLSSRRGVGVRC